MKIPNPLLALLALAASLIGGVSTAHAHATFNIGGYGDIVSGAPNSTNTARVYASGNTGGGVTGSFFQSGTTSDSREVWLNEAPVTEWIGPTGPNKPLPPLNIGQTLLPSAAYVGLHSRSNIRTIETGVYGSTASICATNGDCAGVNTNGNSLLRQLYNANHRTVAGAFVEGEPSIVNPAPTDISLAVAPNSWQTDASGKPVYNTGMDVLTPHTSGYQFGYPPPPGSNLEDNLINLAPTATTPAGPTYLNIQVSDDTSDGLGAQQLGVALYGGWDDGNGLADLTLLGYASAAAPGGEASLTYQLDGYFYGEYTVFIGDLGNNGGQYKAFFGTEVTPLTTVITNPVPLPAAFWLFGSAVLGFLGLGRKRRS